MGVSDSGSWLLAAASMTAFQDSQATAWRDVAIGEIPEVVVYRNPQGTFTRSVTLDLSSLLIMFLVRGQTAAAVPYYGVGVFMPIMVMGLAVRKHILAALHGHARTWGSLGGKLCRGSVSHCVRRPDCGQVGGRRLGRFDLLQPSALAAHLL